MITRQRKRALKIINCHKNLRVLNLVKSEKIKIDLLNKKLKSTEDPRFIEYLKGKTLILSGFTKEQTLKIELEALIAAMGKAQINLNVYHKRLDALLNVLSASTYS